MSNARNLSKFKPSSSGLVETADIADDAVSTDQIANDAVISTSGAITTTGAFTSPGIDDNGDATTITLDANEDITAANGMYVSGDLTSLTIDKGGIDRSGNTTRIISARSGGNYADMSINVAGADLSDGNSGMNRCLYIDYQGNTTIDQGNLVIGTSGKGISFSATADGTSTSRAEILDDYEEGVWTPTINSNIDALTNVQGFYTKIGRMVYCLFHASIDPTSTSSGIGLAGLPFTVQQLVTHSGIQGTNAIFSDTALFLVFPLQGGTTLAIELDRPMQGSASSSSASYRGSFMYATDQ